MRSLEQYLTDKSPEAAAELVAAMGYDTKKQAMEAIGAHRNSANNKLTNPSPADIAIIQEVIVTAPLRPRNASYLEWKSKRAKAVTNIINWATIRQSALKRDEYICRVCGIDAVAGNVEVHHIDRSRLNNNGRNLITLCRTCHQGVHASGYYPGGINWDDGSAWGGAPSDF